MDPSASSILDSLDQVAPFEQVALPEPVAPERTTSAPSELVAPERTTSFAPSELVAPQRTTYAPSELVAPESTTYAPFEQIAPERIRSTPRDDGSSCEDVIVVNSDDKTLTLSSCVKLTSAHMQCSRRAASYKYAVHIAVDQHALLVA